MEGTTRNLVRKEVKSLQVLALDELHKTLHDCWMYKCQHYRCWPTFRNCCKYSEHTKNLKKILDDMPRMCFHRLLEKEGILNDNTFYTMYHPDVPRLKVLLHFEDSPYMGMAMGSEPCQATELMVYSSLTTLSQFPNLRRLSLRPFFNVDDLTTLLSEVGRCCPSLEEFVALSTFPMVQGVLNKRFIRADTAQKMCFADWDDRCKVSNPCCWTLKVLVLPPCLGTQAAAILLRNLHSLVTFSGGCDVTSAFHYSRKTSKKSFPFIEGLHRPHFVMTSLRRMSGEETSGKHIKAMATLCPNLRHFSVHCLHLSGAKNIALLRNLTVLSISSVSWGVLHGVLTGIGHRLKKLQVTELQGFMDLNHLSTKCPRLESLHLWHVRKSVRNIDTLHFANLQFLASNNNNPDDGTLLTFLTSAPELRELHWEGASGLREDQLKEIVILKGALKHLEVFRVADARHLSTPTAYLLIDHCPHLRSMGILESWNNEMKPYDLQAEAVRENWALEILIEWHWRESLHFLEGLFMCLR